MTEEAKSITWTRWVKQKKHLKHVGLWALKTRAGDHSDTFLWHYQSTELGRSLDVWTAAPQLLSPHKHRLIIIICSRYFQDHNYAIVSDRKWKQFQLCCYTVTVKHGVHKRTVHTLTRRTWTQREAERDCPTWSKDTILIQAKLTHLCILYNSFHKTVLQYRCKDDCLQHHGSFTNWAGHVSGQRVLI